MSESRSNSLDRRGFLQAGAAVTAAGLAGGAAAAQEAKGGQNKPVLPTRVLGKTGVKVTMLNQGTVGEPASLNRLLRSAYREGVRYFDTAEGYRNAEGVFHDWFKAEPTVREGIFLATKSHVGQPADMLKKIDARLKRIGTDYLDLLFFHGLSTAQTDWPNTQAH
jgi:aryl-alcohol dehydrogenase-like predicted oxidoreductase